MFWNTKNYLLKHFSRRQYAWLSILTRCSNVILSPHVAGWTFEVMRLAQVIVDKIKIKYFGNANTNKVEKRVTRELVVFSLSLKTKELVNWYGKHLNNR
jgi:phosphoglycerate dehydrogenase-like enzyme